MRDFRKTATYAIYSNIPVNITRGMLLVKLSNMNLKTFDLALWKLVKSGLVKINRMGFRPHEDDVISIQFPYDHEEILKISRGYKVGKKLNKYVTPEDPKPPIKLARLVLVPTVKEMVDSWSFQQAFEVHEYLKSKFK